MMDAEIKQNKKRTNDFTLTFKGLTKGHILAIKKALDSYSEVSSVCNDVKGFLDAEIKNKDISFT